jgi:hypothetical protein
LKWRIHTRKQEWQLSLPLLFETTRINTLPEQAPSGAADHNPASKGMLAAKVVNTSRWVGELPGVTGLERRTLDGSQRGVIKPRCAHYRGSRRPSSSTSYRSRPKQNS